MSDTLSLLKQLLGIDINDTSQDSVYGFYITKSKNAIMKYSLLNEDDYIKASLDNQTIELAMYFYQNKKQIGLKNSSEGNKSKSFEEGIPSSIKITLPKPAIYSM